MDWKDIAKNAGAVGLPAIGAALGGPGGARLGSLLASALGCDSTPEAVSQALVANPDAAVKLREIEANAQIAQITAAAAQVEAVNKTLQTEAMGGSFWQRNHHAYESSFALLLISAIYVLLPAFKIPVPDVPGDVWIMVGAVLGVTAYQRGAANVAVAKGGGDA